MSSPRRKSIKGDVSAVKSMCSLPPASSAVAKSIDFGQLLLTPSSEKLANISNGDVTNQSTFLAIINVNFHSYSFSEN
jgi:hypothetical protein